MMNFLQDPMVVYGISFVIVVALAFRYGRKALFAWLDGEIAKIRTELDTARALRAEAEVALAYCKSKQASAEAEAQEIVSAAKKRVEAMRQKAEADLSASLSRREYLAGERIRMAEVEAVAEVRASAISLAVSLARKNLMENLSEDVASKLVDQAISDMPVVGLMKAEAA